MNVSPDTNILAYVEGLNGPARGHETLVFLDRLERSNIRLSVQVLGELFALLVRKGGQSPDSVRQVVLNWQESFPARETDTSAILEAMELVAAHRLSFWDAVIVAVSVQENCRLLLSEDMQDGFTWRGLTIANPFKPDLHPVLRDLLGTPH